MRQNRLNTAFTAPMAALWKSKTKQGGNGHKGEGFGLPRKVNGQAMRQMTFGRAEKE
ncbi:MAG: hypothetical protein GX061_01780 [Eubacteriaceae bacterium]|nr:hypothetical protein [Eubacteriaceae bacterium]